MHWPWRSGYCAGAASAASERTGRGPDVSGFVNGTRPNGVTQGGTDQHGEPRPAPGGTDPDIGAFELQQMPDAVTGTARRERLHGSSADDHLRGLGGDDRLFGRGTATCWMAAPAGTGCTVAPQACSIFACASKSPCKAKTPIFMSSPSRCAANAAAPFNER